MKLLLLSILYFQVHGFLNNYKYKPLIKPIYSSSSDQYYVKHNSIIFYYELIDIKKIEIQNEINKNTKNRFNINANNIYMSLYDYSNNNLDENKSKCQIFVSVHDQLNNLDGHYILETKEYNKCKKSLVYSFYENNEKFYISFSCFQSYSDNVNYMNDLKFDFMYDNNTYYKNIGNYDKISYTPSYIYCSELKYKNMYWKKSSKVIYYRYNIYYKLLC
jgi:hypothetical protein